MLYDQIFIILGSVASRLSDGPAARVPPFVFCLGLGSCVDEILVESLIYLLGLLKFGDPDIRPFNQPYKRQSSPSSVCLIIHIAEHAHLHIYTDCPT